MQMPGRVSNTASYRYGFNGKEIDSATYSQGNEYDYGFRIYNPRIGKFLSVDPLTPKYPELTPYQFASNSPISGIDLDGLEYYYAADGSLIAKSRDNNTQVRVIKSEDVAKVWQLLRRKEGANTIDLNKLSSSVGITNEELNTRAMLYTIRTTEVAGRTNPYDILFNDKKFGEGIADKEKYKDHPHKTTTRWGITSTAAGAYQILAGTYDEAKKKINIADFTPESQDKIAVWLIDRRKASFSVQTGDLNTAFKLLKNEWSSLPGASQEGLSLEQAKEVFKLGLSKELNLNSEIATPHGQLLTKK